MDPVSVQLSSKNLWAWLVRLVSQHPEWLSTKMRFFLPTMGMGSSDETPDPDWQLRQLHAQGQATWQSFIYGLCMELEVPLHLEVPLLSIWGQDDGKARQLATDEESQSGPQLNQGLKRPHQSCGTSPRRKQCRKQQLELVKKYLQLLKTFTQQHFASQLAHVPPILQWSRASTPLDAQEEAGENDLGLDDDIDVSIQDLFNFKTHKEPRVTVLLGKAGMGKTTLAHWLRQKWASGQLDHFQALFLFEFRHLNLITCFLTLSQLLFDLYLSPESEPDAVFQYLEENARQVLLIFDGLDEALHLHSNKKPVAADGARSALTLFSDLCRGTLLPGCWVMATSRPGKLPTCVPTEAALVYMWGFDGLRVEKYMSYFFKDLLSQEVALAEMRTNRRLRGMCAVPELCRVACLCLHHLLPGSPPGQSEALLPTVTQLYLQMLLSLGPRGTLSYPSLLGLGKVALEGLDTGKVIFSAEDIPPSVMAFGAVHSLLTSFSICTKPGVQETGYAFSHFSLQEFLAALHLMASDRTNTDKLTCHVTLNSHWVLRTQTRHGLSDHLPTFLAGLASHACRPFLSHLAQRDEAWVGTRQAAVVQVLRKLATRKFTGPKVVELCHCVAETQEPELARLTAQNLPFQLSFHNFPLTHADLAALVSILEHRAMPIQLDFDGCPLEPNCPEALMGCGQVKNLSFKSRKCGDAFAEALSRSLPTMGSLQVLGLTGSQVTARGIGHLMQVLPLCSQLEEVGFQDNQLKDSEVLKVIKLLSCLPRLQKLDLSRNNFSTSTLLCLVKAAVTCPAVRKLHVRESDLVFLLSPLPETATEQPRAPGLQDEDSLRKEGQRRSLALRLQKCHLRVHDVEALIELLQEGPRLEEVDLSENYLEDEGCRLLAEAAQQLRITRKLDLSHNELSDSGVIYVLRAMSMCQTLTELRISLLSNTVVLMFAQEPGGQEGSGERAAMRNSLAPPVASEPPLGPRRIRLAHCGFRAKHIEKLCKALGAGCLLSSGHLDLSDNALSDEGLALLAQWLPGLGPLQSLNLSKNGLTLNAVFTLAQSMSALKWLFHLDISLESELVLLRGEKASSLQECQLEPSSLARLCAALEDCPGPLKVQLSCKTLSDEGLETLLRSLPRLPQLSLLQLSHTDLSLRSPLLLADIFGLCPRIRKVDLSSLHHVALHFGSSKEQNGVCCGFTGCSLRQEHMKPLCHMLSQCEALRQLDLTDNLLGDDGLRYILEYLPQLPIAGWLDLSHNRISLEGTLHLLETLPFCPHIRQALVNLGFKQHFRIRFSKQDEAGITLRLSECSFEPEHLPRLAAGLSQAQQLMELSLTQCHLDLQQLTVLLSLVRRQTGLLGLRVQEPWVGQVGVPALLEVCTHALGLIAELSISETQQQLWIQLEFPHHEENPEAVALRLAHCDLGTHHSLLVRQLMVTCNRLRQLSLSQMNLCNGDDASSQLLRNLLLSLCELKSFRLTSSYVSADGLTHLASGLGCCYHLEELDFSHNQCDAENTELLVQALQGTCELRRLHFSHFPLGGSMLAMLIQGLSHMTVLQCLCLSHTQIGDTGAEHLAAILPEFPELRKIDLSGNSIGLAGGVQLAKSLTLCRRLEEVMLGHNVLGDPTALELAQGLPPHLTVLSLPSSHLGPKGALRLVQALEWCPNMEEIILAGNKLAGGVPHFCKGFRLLRQIDMVSCEIDDQAAKRLVASLILCPALEEILLSWNLLGDEAAAELAQVLPQMIQLKRVDLEKNRISAQGAWLLAQGLARGSCIQVIRLWNNPIPPSAAQCLQSQEPRLDFAFFDKHSEAPGDT
uniref:protein NLRC5 n=1 Tax=Jaculus jaculus TaxID=51337 RepID=UPI001E1AF70F|nr:protein NLRC5 [Jaculus jaculus]